MDKQLYEKSAKAVRDEEYLSNLVDEVVREIEDVIADSTAYRELTWLLLRKLGESHEKILDAMVNRREPYEDTRDIPEIVEVYEECRCRYREVVRALVLERYDETGTA